MGTPSSPRPCGASGGRSRVSARECPRRSFGDGAKRERIRVVGAVAGSRRSSSAPRARPGARDRPREVGERFFLLASRIQEVGERFFLLASRIQEIDERFSVLAGGGEEIGGRPALISRAFWGASMLPRAENVWPALKCMKGGASFKGSSSSASTRRWMARPSRCCSIADTHERTRNEARGRACSARAHASRTRSAVRARGRHRRICPRRGALHA